MLKQSGKKVDVLRENAGLGSESVFKNELLVSKKKVGLSDILHSEDSSAFQAIVLASKAKMRSVAVCSRSLLNVQVKLSTLTENLVMG